jgi:hypothetical protein
MKLGPLAQLYAYSAMKCPPAVSRRLGLLRNKPPVLSSATTTGSSLRLRLPLPTPAEQT